MAEGPQSGLELIDKIAATGDLDGYHLLFAARADLLRRIGAKADAAKNYTRALELVTNDGERRYLARRLEEVKTL
jgi:RNA polymerase sigma-70 factor (ECF subfamily)